MDAKLTRKNRSRCVPTPSGRRTEITDNDIFGIFEPLSRHAQLTTKQLVAFGRRYPNKTRARLTTLFHEEGQWLTRLGQDIKFVNYLALDEIHRLDSDAAQLLLARGVIPNAEWVFNTRIGGHSNAPSRIIRLAHDHMASDIVLDIEIGARDAGSPPFKSHIAIINAAPEATRARKNPLRIPVPEIVAAPKWIEPDAVFALGSHHYAVEADMGTETIDTIIRGKILAYREIVAAGTIDDHLGIDDLTVLFVTTNETRMRNMMRELESIARNGRTPMFAFACRPDLANFMQASAPIGRMLQEPWARVGFSDLVLGMR
jgi:hypothetical protein